MTPIPQVKCMLGINCLKDSIFKKYRINCLSFSTLFEVYSYHEPFYVPKKKNLTKCIQLLPSKTGFIHSIFEFYDYSERSVGEQRELYKPMHWKKRAKPTDS